MANRFALLLISLLVLGFVVAGCGDDDDDDSASGGDTTAAETTQESTAEEDSGGEEKEDSGGGDATDPAVQKAVDDCKASVNASSLSAGVKKDLEDICEKAATGTAEDVREATKDVCIKIVEETVPAGAAQDQAVDACNTATAG